MVAIKSATGQRAAARTDTARATRTTSVMTMAWIVMQTMLAMAATTGCDLQRLGGMSEHCARHDRKEVGKPDSTVAGPSGTAIHVTMMDPP